MKLKDLIDEVYALGFESASNVGVVFYTSLNRALSTIYSEYPSERSVKIIVEKPEGRCIISSLYHNGISEERYKISGAAFSLKTAGSGTLTVTDENGAREHSFSGSYKIIRDFLRGDAEITFSGSFSYTVRDLYVYDSVSSERPDEIPYHENERRIVMSDYTDDFSSFSRLPRDAAGKMIPAARISGDVLYIPSNFFGEISIFYNIAPKKIKAEDVDTVIELPGACSHLLALLCAAYMWLDDDAERSSYYMQLYRDGMSRAQRDARATLDTSFQDVLGWA